MHRRLLVAVLVTVSCGACAVRSPWERVPSGNDPRSVALIVEGSAFARSGVARRVREAVEAASGRRVVMVDAEASSNDDAVKSLAARLRKVNPSIAPYDWRERWCRSTGPVLTSVTTYVDGFYRVTLQYAEQTRPATAQETVNRGRMATVLNALHLARADTAREESVSGSVVMTSFSGDDRPVRVPVARSATQVEPTVITPGLDPGAVAGDAIRSLPPLPAPRWDAVARRLTAAGCPFTALMVCETRLDGTAAHGSIRTAALAAMQRSEKPARTKRSATRAERAPKDVEESAMAETPAPDERYSCTTLCGMHMVELCNRDKSLWSAHGATWQATPCGTKREESFLADCYRRQWLTGAAHDSCVVPCESGREGRDRLLGILQSAGCLRGRRS
jgi:hypothetical protein